MLHLLQWLQYIRGIVSVDDKQCPSNLRLEFDFSIASIVSTCVSEIKLFVFFLQSNVSGNVFGYPYVNISHWAIYLWPWPTLCAFREGSWNKISCTLQRVSLLSPGLIVPKGQCSLFSCNYFDLLSWIIILMVADEYIVDYLQGLMFPEMSLHSSCSMFPGFTVKIEFHVSELWEHENLGTLHQWTLPFWNIDIQ